ncbi:MAG TPA: class I SAM-dependent methyltransferase [Balneolaceae bacterium]
MKKFISNILASAFPQKWKEYAELSYWKSQKSQEGNFSNDHYKFFYTQHFLLDDEFYSNKKILDIGCGPRGSLEWATMSERRVGLDPLAESYLKLGADKHQMEYYSSPSEKIPFEDAYFDVACAFNSLDHVSNVGESISEIKRVVKSKGLFLLLVEINHEPTNCEPHKFEADIVERFNPEFKCLNMKVFKSVETGLYDSVKAGSEYPNPYDVTQTAWLSAKFERV